MTNTEIKKILEALLLVSEKPLLVVQAHEALGPQVESAQVRACLEALVEDYAVADRGIRIVEVAEGFQLITNPEFASYVTQLTHRVRTVRLSKAALETLAIIAYRQPLTRVEMEQIRGVDGSGVLDTLLKLDLIRIVGRKDAIGRPLIYGTTRQFLDHFGIKSLENLPSLEELRGVPGELKEVTGISSTPVHPEISEEGEEEKEEEPITKSQSPNNDQ